MPADRSPRRSPQPRSRRAERRPPPARDVRPAEERTTHLQDPRAIRALAHPARMAIIDALASGDELTATECAELTGLSPSATAYHLNLLERYHLAEPAPARSDGRQRPWRAPARTVVDLDTSTPAGAAAASAVGLAFLDRSRTLAEAFLAAAPQEPEAWRDLMSLGNADLWLTVAETRRMTADLAAVLDPYRGRALTDRPDGTRRIRVMNLVSPHPGPAADATEETQCPHIR